MDEIHTGFTDRIVDVDRAIAAQWGQLTSDRTRPVVDSILAATAIVRGMTLVTRNERDIADTGVKLLNPWDA